MTSIRLVDSWGKIPAVAKSAQRYDSLAEWARAHGYVNLTGSTVHSWLKRGLPFPVIDERPAFGRRNTHEPDETYAALLAACKYRYDYEIRSIGVVGTILWLRGFAVDARLVREGLIWFASNPTRLVRLLSHRLEVLESNDVGTIAGSAGVTFAYHPELPARFPRAAAAGFDRAALATGVSDLLALLLGAPVQPDPAGVQAMATLLDAEGSFTAEAMRDVAGTRLRPAVLVRRIRRMSARSLGLARDRALSRLVEANTDDPIVGMLALLSEVAVGHLAPQRVKYPH